MRYTDAEILAARGPKYTVDPRRPVSFFVEQERSSTGTIDDVATIFLTNRECPFRCLMCDLWMHTTDERVPLGAIVEQIDFALRRMPPAQHVKLYNSGNFFDAQAIPPEDHPEIIRRVQSFQSLIVENHPRLCTVACVHFQQQLGRPLEMALGLETVHPEILPALNKRMTLDDFARATSFLLEHDIAVRAFILLRPPPLDEQQGVEWALKSVEYAFDQGVGCCSIIPTRGGSGLLQHLQQAGAFQPPHLSSMERVLADALKLNRGRVTVDLWDLETFANCTKCLPARRERLRHMNLHQEILPPVACSCESPS